MTQEVVGTEAQQSVHRRDIDGLRAVAVLPVVAYHVGIHAVPGGFVGVDIFLVISGFLITQVLLQDIHGDRFSLIKFYERRARRILPALLAMLLITFAVCARYSVPTELIDFSKSLIAAVASASNIYFWQTAGYFDGPALTKPVLHTWSLAVEEQFYIFWPLLLWIGLRRFRHHMLAATIAVVVVSLVVSAIGAFTHPSATFYLLHTRAWELLLGALLPLGAFSAPLGPAMRNALSVVGLALIAASVETVDPDMPFPGLLALPPCLGAFLIILAGRDGESFAGRILSWKPIAFIGLISYSLYLWHWPIAVFQRNYSLLLQGGSDRAQKLTIIMLSLVLALLSWRFIEQPFRVGKRRPSRTALFQMATAASVLLVVLGGVAWSAGGFPARYTKHQLEIASFLNYNNDGPYRAGRCFIYEIGSASFAPECTAVDGTRSNYLLLGDSHAAELWYGLHTVFPTINFLQTTASGCFPVIHHHLGEVRRCINAMDYVLNEFLQTHKVSRVILAARWKGDYLGDVTAILDWFRDRHIPVTLIGPTVVYDSPLPRLLLTADRTGNAALVETHWDHSLLDLDKSFAAAAAAHGADYISMIKLLCAEPTCSSVGPTGMPLIKDREHYTMDGSKRVAGRIMAANLFPDERRPDVAPAMSAR